MSLQSQTANMKALASLLSDDLGYIFGERESGPNGAKKAFHSCGRAFLRALGRDLGFEVMLYAPLDAKTRDFVGDNWTAAQLGNVKRLLHLSKGVVYSRRPFFEAVWGATIDEFEARLRMPKAELEGWVRRRLINMAAVNNLA